MQAQRTDADVAATGSRGSPDRGRTRLIGRAAELDVLTRTVEDAFGSGIRAALVTGGPGSGKTRLAAELADRSADDATVLWARATRWGASTSFGMWVEALDRYLRDRSDEELRELAGPGLPVLATFLTALGGLTEDRLTRQPRRDEMLHALMGLLDRLAATSPVLLVLDDVHLADTSSWEALGFAVRRLAGTPVAVIATARPTDLRGRAGATEVTVRLEEEGLLTRLPVPPLTRPEIAELAHEVLRREPGTSSAFVPDTLITWLSDRSLGLPLYITGLLRALVEEGSDLTAPRLDRIPGGLRERVGVELQTLDPDDREVLEALAVIGARTEFPEVAATAGLTIEEVAGRLERLVRSGFVAEHGRGADLRYEIAHPVIQDAIYEGIGGARRVVLHRQVARQMLEEGRLGIAAAHFARAGAPGDDEAVDALCEAFAQSQSRDLYQEALVTLTALLDTLPEGDRRWLRVLDALTVGADWVLSHLVEADADTAVAAMRRLADVLGSEDDPAAEATVQLHLAAFLALGTTRHEEAERACHRAIELFDEVGQPVGALLARNELAWIRGGAGDLDTHAELAAGVYGRAMAEGWDRPAMVAAGTAAYALGMQGRFDRAGPLYATGTELAVRTGNTYREAWTRAQHALMLGLEGELGAAFDAAERALEVDDAAADALAYEDLAHTLWLAGRLQDGAEVLARSAARRPVRGSRRRAWGSALAARLYGEMGQRGRARSSLQHADSTYADGHTMVWSFWADWTRAFLAWLDDDQTTAALVLTTTADHLSSIGACPYEAMVLLDLLELMAELGDRDGVVSTAARLRTVADTVDGPLALHLAALGTAREELLLGDLGAAAQNADAAARGLDAGGYRLLGATARSLHGQALERQDREAAVADLQAAADEFDRCGAIWRRDRALAVLRSLGSRGRRAASEVQGPGALTKREREVAQLAAGVNTAREIGEQLFIGVRTVESHLASIYAKLGVASKRELARRAEEFGLHPPDP